jgi:hypothetical protein
MGKIDRLREERYKRFHGFVVKRTRGQPSNAVIALQAIGRLIRQGETIPRTHLHAVSDSELAHYCSVQEIIFGAGYTENDAKDCYEAPE